MTKQMPVSRASCLGLSVVVICLMVSNVIFSIVDYMMTWSNLELIDEFLWEQHVDNYLMAPEWGDFQDKTKTIADSYDYFSRLRRRGHGVRAHSGV